MTVLEIVLISIISVFLAGVLLYWLAGYIAFSLSMKKKNPTTKIIEEVMEHHKQLYRYDTDWWDEVPCEKWTANSLEGLKLCAAYIKKHTKKVVIVVHGYGANHYEMQRYAKLFYDYGYSVLAPDNRAHGDSEGEFISMGWLDKQDIHIWITRLIKVMGSDVEILLFGLSMGAATVCMLSGDELPDNVKGIISDCAYDSLYNQCMAVLKRFHSPFKKLQLAILGSYMKRVYSYNIKPVDAKPMLKNCKVPILFIHGGKDKFVPTKMVHVLFDAAPDNLKEIKVFDGAEHALSLPLNPEAYEKTVASFLERRIGWK